MNKTLKQILITLASIIAIAVLTIGVSFLHINKTLADSGSPNTIIKMSVSTGVTVTSSSTSVLAASSGRVYAVFVNDSSNPIYLTLGPTAVSGSGVRLNADGGSYEINLSNDYIGVVTAIASGNSNLTVTAAQ